MPVYPTESQVTTWRHGSAVFMGAGAGIRERWFYMRDFADDRLLCRQDARRRVKILWAAAVSSPTEDS